MGLFARQNCAFFENHGSTVFGRYLSIRSCSAFYDPHGCFAKFFDYGLGCWGWAVVSSDSWEVNKLIRLCQEALGATCLLDRHGQRNIKNSITQTYVVKLGRQIFE
jgi:hypothetical protein